MSSTPRSILIVLSMLGNGGTEKAVLSIADIYHRLGYQVSLYIGNPRDAHTVPVPAYVKLRFGPKKRSLSAKIRGMLQFRRLLKHTDIVVAGSEKRPTYLVAFLGASKTVRRYALVHSTLPLLLANQSAKHRWLMGRAYRRFDKIICVSKALEQAMRSEQSLACPPHALQTVYSSMDFDQLKQAAQAPISPEIQTQITGPFILCLARIAREKSHDVLLNAFAKIHQQLPHQLVLCGKTDPELTQALMTQAAALGMAEKVIFLGHVENPYPLLKQASCLALSSDREGAALVLLEALALAIPVVATDCPVGPRELLADGKYGQLVPVGDSQALAVAIQTVLQQPVTFPANLAAYLTQFNAETIFKQWQQLEQNENRVNS